jgi:beta-lactamase regulating signal transducer with metallopeptidase domain
MSVLSQSSLVDALGWMLIHTLWQGTLAAAILAIVLLPLRGRAPAMFSNLRYIFACATLLALLAASIATFAIYYSASPLKLPVDTSFHQVFENPPLSQTPPIQAVSPEPIGFPRLLPMVVALWSVGLFMQFAWQSASMLRIHRKARGEQITDQRWTQALKRIAARLGIRRAVQLVSSRRLDVPAVIGMFRPVIVIPFAMLNETSIDHAQAILAHELAHIRRFDYFANLIQIGIETIFFYHPAVWWISSQIRRERENCCDDIAASVCGRVTCASALVALESRRALRAVPAASGGSLLRRVRRILGEPQTRGGWMASLLVAVIAVLCICAPLYWPSVTHGQSQVQGPATTQSDIVQSEILNDEKSSDNSIRSELELQLNAITDERRAMEQKVAAMQAQGDGDQDPDILRLKQKLDAINVKIAEFQDQIDQHTKKAEHLFVDLTVSANGSLTSDGAPSSWHEIDRRLEDMPESQQRITVLALSAASPDVSVGMYFNAQYQAERLVQNHHLAYLSMTGINPPHKPFPAALPQGLSHEVPFKIGKTYFNGGDIITIQKITGSSDRVIAPNTFEITGSYHLVSQKQGLLAVHVTSWGQNPPGQQDCVPIKINKGDGQFTIKLHMWCDGSPHVSIYLGGDSSDCVYFGTEPSQLN